MNLKKFTNNPKSLLIAIGAVLLASGILLALLFTMSEGQSSGNKFGNLLDRFLPNTAPREIVSEKQTSRIVTVGDRAVISPVNGTRSGTAVYFEKNTGRIVESRLDGAGSRELSKKNLPNFIRAVWSPDREAAIGLFSASTSFSFNYFRTAEPEKLYRLPSDTQTVVFSPSGDRIAFFSFSGDAGAIFISNPDGTIAKKVLSTRIPDIQLYWPQEDALYFSTKERNFNMWNLFRISFSGDLTSILKSENSLDAVFSPSGKLLLYSSMDAEALPSLYVLDLQEQKSVKLKLRALASQCAWSIDEKTVFCGASPPSVKLDPSFVRAIIPNTVFTVFPETGEYEPLFTQTQDSPAINVREPFLSPLEDYILFVNGFDGRLYGIKK